MGFDVARHLLSRTAVGATPAEVEGLASMDFPAAVERLLTKVHPGATRSPPAWVDDPLSALREKRQEARASASEIADGKPVNEAAG
jgi:hypothetical protein